MATDLISPDIVWLAYMGEQRARDKVLLAMQPTIKAIAAEQRSRVEPHMTCADLAQEMTLELLGLIDRYVPNSSVPFHLYAAKRLKLAAIDWARRVAKRGMTKVARAKATDIKTANAGDDYHSWSDPRSTSIFEELISDLKKSEQTILRLRFVHRKSAAEIAGMYEANAAEIETQINRLLAKLHPDRDDLEMRSAASWSKNGLCYQSSDWGPRQCKLWQTLKAYVAARRRKRNKAGKRRSLTNAGENAMKMEMNGNAQAKVHAEEDQRTLVAV